MANDFHDIIPPERRSIRNITTTHRHPRRRPRPEEVPAEGDQGVETSAPQMAASPVQSSDDGEQSFLSRFGLWIIAVISLIVFVLAFSLLFSGTKVTVVPKQQDVFIDGQFESFANAEVGQLAYEIVSVERTKTKTVPATGKREVEERASGRIVIFNDFDTANQRLITNTRFETPDGLIYRVDEPVVVPGQSTKDGEVIPGSIEVTVYADEPGDGYNIGLTDFTIPGFKGGARFDGFYARSRTPMSGGFVGEKLVAKTEDVERERVALRVELEEELKGVARTEVPEGFHLFDDGLFISYENLPDGEQGDDVEVREKATLRGVLYRLDEIARFVAGNTVAGYEGEEMEIQDPNTLNYTILDRETARPWEEESVSFTIKGNAKLVWLYDEGRLREDLAGRSKDALPTVLSGYSSIEEAKVSLRPFWRRSFPDDASKIGIERSLE